MLFKLVLGLAMLLPKASFAAQICFVAKENNQILKEIGYCQERHSPCSTFKIPLALMGFDAGVLSAVDAPYIPLSPDIEKKYLTYYHPEKHPNMLFWKRGQTPKTWMRDSVVWYSRVITHQLGMNTFQDYVRRFDYGNQDVLGDAKKKDGLMNAWLGSSLTISPLEQLEFIGKLANKTLPVSQKAQEETIQLIDLGLIQDDWHLYGKTGGGETMGWFVGWIEKDNHRIVFAQYLEQTENSLIGRGALAKVMAINHLIDLIAK